MSPISALATTGSTPSSMKIGVTGLIGSGKSTVAMILGNFGASVIDADLIGKQVVESDKTLLRKLAHAFESDILTPSGRLRRDRLAKYAFESSESRARLDRLVHPPLLKQLRSQIKLLTKRGGVVVVDAALIFHWSLERELDHTILVHATRIIRIGRLRSRSISTGEFVAREKQQLPINQQRKRADTIVYNSGTKGQLKEKLAHVWTELGLKGIDS